MRGLKRACALTFLINIITLCFRTRVIKLNYQYEKAPYFNRHFNSCCLYR